MEFLKVIKTRKSTRGYKPNQITKQELDTLLSAASLAPIGMKAYDTIHMTVIQNKDFLDRITKATAKLFENPDIKPFYGAPTVIIVSGMPNPKAPHIEYANTACIIENMLLMATDIGLGSVYLWGFLSVLNTNPDILKELELPNGFKPLSAVALGYPEQPLTEEKELKITLKYNSIK